MGVGTGGTFAQDAQRSVAEDGQDNGKRLVVDALWLSEVKPHRLFGNECPRCCRG